MNGVRVDAPFPVGHPRRPIAAVALSPMGVNTTGLYDTAPGEDDNAKDHSWAGLVDIPVITLTGDGDNHCKPSRFVCSESDSGSRRMTPFARMPAGGKSLTKYLMYIDDRKTDAIVSSHEMFGDFTSPVCAGNVAQCELTRTLIKSTVIAFLDAHVLNVRSAKNWLQTNKIAKASKGIANVSWK